MKRVLPKDQPLCCVVEGGVLTISIGVDTLAFADAERNGLDIINPAGFAEDVARELTKEKEDGSTPLTDLLDEAMENAANNGSVHQEIEVEIVVNGKKVKADSGFITYEQIAALAKKRADFIYTCTYCHGWPHDYQGTLSPGDRVRVKKGMMFDIMDTSRA
jgi:hypothetical protein